jgi:hypothetical protein
MLSLLLALGTALVLFGAVVLLRFSDRPGASLKWLGMELTSSGAGLPLIALGIGCIVFSVLHTPASPTEARESTGVASTSSADGCLGEFVSAVPADRVASLEAGMSAPVVTAPQRLDLPFALLLTQDGERIGGVRFRLYPGPNYGSDLYKLEAAVDVDCHPIEGRNASRGGDPRSLVNFDSLRLRLGAHEYDLRVGGEGDIEVTFSRVS